MGEGLGEERIPNFSISSISISIFRRIGNECLKDRVFLGGLKQVVDSPPTDPNNRGENATAPLRLCARPPAPNGKDFCTRLGLR